MAASLLDIHTSTYVQYVPRNSHRFTGRQEEHRSCRLSRGEYGATHLLQESVTSLLGDSDLSSEHYFSIPLPNSSIVLSIIIWVSRNFGYIGNACYNYFFSSDRLDGLLRRFSISIVYCDHRSFSSKHLCHGLVYTSTCTSGNHRSFSKVFLCSLLLHLNIFVPEALWFSGRASGNCRVKALVPQEKQAPTDPRVDSPLDLHLPLSSQSI